MTDNIRIPFDTVKFTKLIFGIMFLYPKSLFHFKRNLMASSTSATDTEAKSSLTLSVVSQPGGNGQAMTGLVYLNPRTHEQLGRPKEVFVGRVIYPVGALEEIDAKNIGLSLTQRKNASFNPNEPIKIEDQITINVAPTTGVEWAENIRLGIAPYPLKCNLIEIDDSFIINKWLTTMQNRTVSLDQIMPMESKAGILFCKVIQIIGSNGEEMMYGRVGDDVSLVNLTSQSKYLQINRARMMPMWSYQTDVSMLYVTALSKSAAAALFQEELNRTKSSITLKPQNIHCIHSLGRITTIPLERKSN